VAPGPQKPGRIGESEDDLRAKKGHATDELSASCEELEGDLEELKAKYEMYFLGVERIEPAIKRGDVKRRIARLKNAFTRNIGLKFRIQTLHARYLTYERLWLRSVREKEEGTYRRDLFKARLRAKKPPVQPMAPKPTSDAHPQDDVDLSDWSGGFSAPAAPVAPPPRPAPQKSAAPAPASASPARAAPKAPAASGMPGEAQMRELYDSFIAAKRRCNEDVSRITYEAVAKSVTKQVPDLMTRHNAKSVEFKVLIRDGKAVLKAIPKI
jgi:hypothetical protein